MHGILFYDICIVVFGVILLLFIPKPPNDGSGGFA